MSDTYFVLWNSDGDVHMSTYTKERLLEVINNKEFGHDVALSRPVEDLAYLDGIIIIKGKIVTPESKQVTVEYDIE